jgi:DNA-binding transcriptional regulator YiaG
MKNWTPKEIKKLKNKYGLSQKKLSDLLGVTRIHIYYLEKGVREPSKTLSLLLDCVEEKLKRKG